jgi:23S rRNA pseudouridine1911/1915/1917 synthase
MSELRGIHYGVVHLHVGAVPVATLQNYLLENGVDRAEILISLGAVYVNDQRVLIGSTEVRTGDYVRAHTQPRRFSKPPGLKSRIIEQTSGYILFDKPAGIPVHSQVDNARENLLSFLEEELGEDLFVTHRLDTETSGCILIARTSEARSQINQLFRDRKIKKNYVAVVERAVQLGHYTHFMEPSFKSPKVLSEQAQDGWIQCELIILTCSDMSTDSQKLFEVEIELLTGRPQQIRAQLAYLSAPIIGDTRYGSTVSSSEPNSIGLRCSELLFDKNLLSKHSHVSFADAEAGD